MASVELQNLSHSFGRGEMRRQVLQNISLRIDPGEVVLLTIIPLLVAAFIGFMTLSEDGWFFGKVPCPATAPSCLALPCLAAPALSCPACLPLIPEGGAGSLGNAAASAAP